MAISSILAKMTNAAQTAAQARSVKNLTYEERLRLAAYVTENDEERKELQELKDSQTATWRDPMVAYNDICSWITELLSGAIDADTFITLWWTAKSIKLPGGNAARPIVTAFETERAAREHGESMHKPHLDPIVMPHLWLKDAGTREEILTGEGTLYYMPTGEAELELFGHLKLLRSRAAVAFVEELVQVTLYPVRHACWIAAHLFDGAQVLTMDQFDNPEKGFRIVKRGDGTLAQSKSNRLIHRWFRLSQEEMLVFHNTLVSTNVVRRITSLRLAWRNFWDGTYQVDSNLMELLKRDLAVPSPAEFINGKAGQVLIFKQVRHLHNRQEIQGSARILFERLPDGRWRTTAFNLAAAQAVLQDGDRSTTLRYMGWTAPIKMPEFLKTFIREGHQLDLTIEEPAEETSTQ